MTTDRVSMDVAMGAPVGLYGVFDRIWQVAPLVLNVG